MEKVDIILADCIFLTMNTRLFGLNWNILEPNRIKNEPTFDICST
jgi:hypothetical protein